MLGYEHLREWVQWAGNNSTIYVHNATGTQNRALWSTENFKLIKIKIQKKRNNENKVEN